MSFQGTIIVKNAGHLIPTAFLEHALKQFPTLVSIASATDGKFETDGMLKDHTIVELDEWNQLFKDQDMIMYLGEYPDKFPEDTVPPFVLVSEKVMIKGEKEPIDEPKLLLFTDGEFNDYAQTNSTHSGAFFAVQKYFQPKISKWMDGKQENLSKVVMPKLLDEDIQENITNHLAGPTCVVFYDHTGKLIVCTTKKDDEAISHDWGFASNGCGWEPEAEKKQEEPAPAAATSVPSTGKSRFRRASSVNTEAANDRPAPKSIDDAEKTQETPAEAPIVPKRDEETPARVGDSEQEPQTVKLLKDVPAHLINKKPRANWMKAELGIRDEKFLPHGYKTIKQIERVIPLSQLASFLEKGWKAENGFKAAVTKKDKDTTNHHIPVGNKEFSTQPTPAHDDGFKPFQSDKEGKPVGGVRSVEQQKELQAEFKTILGINAKELSVNPGNIHKLVAKFPSAFEQAGQKNVGCLLYCTPDNLTNLRIKYPEWYDQAIAQALHVLFKELEASGKLKDYNPFPAEQDDTTKVEAKMEEVTKPTVSKGASRFTRKVA